MRSKKNKKKLIIAIILGVVATFSLFNSMNSQKAVINELNKKLQEQKHSLSDLKKNPFQAPQKEDGVKAVIAAKDIKVGDVFALEDIETKKFPEDEIPKEIFKNEAMVVGKKAGKNIAKGGFITQAEIQAADANTIDIPNDTRAITIPVERFRGLASHIKVGSRVDIIKVTDPPEFIAQNIKVVSFEAAAEPVTTRRNANQPATNYMSAKRASAITFLVPLDLVSTLIDAAFDNQLQVITRNSTDEKIIVTETELPPPPSGEIASIPDIPDIPEKDKDLPQPAMPKPEPKKIEFIKASSINTVEVKSDDYQAEEPDESLSDENIRELLDMVE